MNTPNQATANQTPQPDPDAAIMIGGLDNGLPANTQDPAQTDPNATASDDPPKEIFRVNGKSFASPEEMSAYVADLEVKALRAQNSQLPNTIPSTQTNEQLLIDGKPIDDLLFESPTKFVKAVVDHVNRTQDIAKDKEQKKALLWDRFYTQNPDLRSKDWAVKAILNEKLQDWVNLPEDQGMKMLALESRSRLKALGVNSGTVTEMHETNAGTLSSTASTPGKEKPKEKQPINFLEQMRNLRRKKSN